MARQPSGNTEASLLMFVLLILSAGLGLVFLGRTLPGVPSDSLNVNSATADDFVRLLRIDSESAERLVAFRTRNGSFGHVEQLITVGALAVPDERDKVSKAVSDNRIDPQTVTVSELVSVTGISKWSAYRIITHRSKLADQKFRKPADILRVAALEDHLIQRNLAGLIVRTPAQVFYQLFMRWLVVAIFIILSPLICGKPKKSDPYLLPLSFLIAGFGIITLFSVKDPFRDTAVYQHHVSGWMLGMMALFATSRLRSSARQNLRQYTYVWALLAVGLLVGLALAGSGPEGVKLSLFGIQPVEIIKLLMVLFIAGYLSDRGDLLADSQNRWRPAVLKGKLAKLGITMPRKQDAGPLIGMYALGLALFLVVRDMGPAMLLFGTFVLTLYVVTGRLGILLTGGLMLTAGLFFANLFHIGVVPTRIAMWLSPWNNSHPNGMQLGQGLWAMASGGWSGSGLGLGSPALIPRSGSDLVFESFGEEMGLVGGLTMLAVYVLIIWRGLHIARKATHNFDRILATGLTCLFGVQAFLIIAGGTGLLPLTGITLPFLAHGNSSLVADFILIGLLRSISTRSESHDQPIVSQILSLTTRRTATGFAVAFFVLIGVFRLMWVQFLAQDAIAGHLLKTPDADKVTRSKTNPRLLDIERAIVRGSIYDRNGRILATSRPSEISKSMAEASQSSLIESAKGRFYPRGSDFAHIIGYVGPSMGGPAHMEKEFDKSLRGFDEYSDLVAEYRSKDLPLWLTGATHHNGLNLWLTMDAQMQRTAQISVKARAKPIKLKDGMSVPRGAAMVALDPKSGDVLASATWPTIDPNGISVEDWNRAKADEDGSHRLLDRSRQGLYPPGSTLKIAIAAAALSNNLDPAINCEHTIKNLKWNFGGQFYGRRTLSDDLHDPPHGNIHMADALTVSCNLYFAQLGIAIGPQKLRDYLFEPSGLGLPHSVNINLFARDLPDNSFGQGIMLTSPMDMARISAAIANEGTMLRPRFWSALKSTDGKTVRENPVIIASHPLTPQNASKLGGMMRSVVQRGTARNVFDEFQGGVAGKTGTAQNRVGDKQPHAWFVGFAPFKNPQVAFACVVENGGYGKIGAAPAIRDFLRAFRPEAGQR